MNFRIHKEGIKIILLVLAVSALILLGAYYLNDAIFYFCVVGLFVFNYLVIQFFRNPIRTIEKFDNNIVYAPADGKIVVIEKTIESEYFNDKRIQISIFMSPLNVHVSRYPIVGTVAYVKYHAGKFLTAWQPKSSTENERATIVIDNGKNKILLRQIAGAVARRIITYSKVGDTAIQGEDLGFIRFGSRVDIFLPLDAEIKVELNQIAIGNKTVLAILK